jgi:hypothetical protein
MHRIWKVRHAAGVIEVQVRIDDIAHIFGAGAQALKLGVDRMLASKTVRPERSTQSRSPIFFAAIGIGDYAVDARVPKDQWRL